MAVESAPVWRRLGEILIERGLLNALRLQSALHEQERNGGRLGEILFANGWVSAVDLRDALAEQHGLDLRVETRTESSETPIGGRSGLPLGRLLVERGNISEAQLEAALARQADSGLQLGQLLTESGAVSPATLAEAVAEQQGLLAAQRHLQATLAGDFVPKPTWYELREKGEAAPGPVLYASPNFMDTTDLAFAILTEWDPGELHIVTVATDGAEELCWRYPPQAQAGE
jgi:hypothetical protein